jgi:CRT-like, chloroquine-resistance transporter-like
MLRQALDDAARGERQTGFVVDASAEQVSSEVQPLIRSGAQESSYTMTSSADVDAESDMRSSDDDDEEGHTMEDWQSEDLSQVEPTPTAFARLWETAKSFLRLVLNVENLWDSPSQNNTPEISRRNHYIVFFWFFILASSYAMERSTFKLLVDRSGPFRLFAVEMITFIHALMIGTGMLVSAFMRKDFSFHTLGIPVVDVGCEYQYNGWYSFDIFREFRASSLIVTVRFSSVMALLDTVHLLLVFLTGYHVAPTLTVILVQFTLPLTALITQFVHSDGCVKSCCGSTTAGQVGVESSRYALVAEGRPRPGWGGLSTEHIMGSIMITIAVLLALSPSLYSIWDPDFFIYADTIPIQTAYNTMLFVSSCIPAAASQLYKEHIFLQYKQPVQADLLNLILSLFQLIFASIMSPLVYTLLGLAATKDWPKLYPSSGFSQNFVEGFQCFMGVLNEDRAMNGYEDEADCDFVFVLVTLHAFSIIAIGVAVDKIVNAGATKVMFRGISAGIIVAVVGLYIYDLRIPDFSYGPAIDSLNLVCVLLLVVGSEVYHRVSLQDATFETVYPEIENVYDDE